MADPTIYPDLNAILRELVASEEAILSDNLHGVYLQGSFALGDADVYSDVDFLVVTVDEIDAATGDALQRMHGRIFALDVPWAQHLEGSYAPIDRVCRIEPARSPWLYLDNGASELIWSAHCNTAVVRWSLREHGVVLSGPEPKSFMDTVPACQLRSDVLAAMPEWGEWAMSGSMSRWKQPTLVLSYCRMLHTLSVGAVTSKRAAGEWALGALDPEWANLIRRALDDRPDPWKRVHQSAEPEAADRTLAFIGYAEAVAGGQNG